MIYFIGNEELIKIGFSDNPTRRLKEISDASPFPVKMYAVIEGEREKEQFIHQQFKAYHIHKEWFMYKGSVRDFITAIGQDAKEVQYREKFFGRIKELRLKHGLSLYDMAKLLNVKPPTVDEFERNADKDGVKLRTLKRYLSILGYEVEIVKKAA